MAGLQETLASVLASRYLANASRVDELASALTSAEFWKKPLPYGNSFGHLVLHLTGNLNYYVGAQIANTGYIRDRPREFNEPNPPLKDEALQRFHDAVGMVLATIGKQTPENWSADYSAIGTNCTNRLDIVVQCAAHMQHHIGQMIYVNCEWKRQAGQ